MQNIEKTEAIWTVKVTTNPQDVKNCRHVAFVDSRDTKRGCGLTVQPSPLECLEYQVLLAGGDTLLSNGFIGEAYQCVAPSPTPSELSVTPTPSPTPTPQVVAPVSPTPATQAPAPLQTSPAPASTGMRFVQSREAVKGCVYMDEIDLKAECPTDGTGTPNACIAERAARARGNTVLVEGDRALIFSCK